VTRDISPGRPGRPERPINPHSPFAEFAIGLRDLRLTAGLTIRDLAQLASYSAATVSTAAGGVTLPSLNLTLAYVRACGGDPEQWTERWRQMAAQQASRPEAAGGNTQDSRGIAERPDLTEQVVTSTPVSLRIKGGSGVGSSERRWHIPDRAPVQKPVAAGHVITPSGRVVDIPVGSGLVFGRGPDVDLLIPSGRGFSRRAGVLQGIQGGVWVGNLSRTHALYAEGDGYRIRLPRMDKYGEVSAGWFLRAGTALVGSRVMLDEGQPLRVVAAEPGETDMALTGGEDDDTLLPLYLDPNTKLFLVALMWCRPWLIDPARGTPLPRTAEIARAALEVTHAHHEIDCFDDDPAFRDRLSARVGEHLKVLRRKIVDRALVRPGTRLSDEVAVGALIENGVITTADLARIGDPAWCSRQEDLWWSTY